MIKLFLDILFIYKRCPELPNQNNSVKQSSTLMRHVKVLIESSINTAFENKIISVIQRNMKFEFAEHK